MLTLFAITYCEFKSVWVYTSALPPCFLDMGADNFAYLPPGLVFRIYVLHPQSVFLCFIWVSCEQSLFPYTALTDWFLVSGTDWMFKIEVNFQT
jgi:hypothetical protein